MFTKEVKVNVKNTESEIYYKNLANVMSIKLLKNIKVCKSEVKLRLIIFK